MTTEKNNGWLQKEESKPCIQPQCKVCLHFFVKSTNCLRGFFVKLVLYLFIFFRCGGHDQSWRPPWGWDFTKFANPLQWKLDLYLYWIHFGGCESISDFAHLYCWANQIIQGEKDWWITSSYFCHWRQLLHINEKVQQYISLSTYLLMHLGSWFRFYRIESNSF